MPIVSVGKDEDDIKWGRLFLIEVYTYMHNLLIPNIFAFIFRQSLVVGKLATLRLKAVYAELEMSAKQTPSVSKNLKV